MTQRCECEHWQQCPTCTPDGFDAAGNRKPPEPTARQACSAELDEWRKLRDPETLHANLLRGQPARLSREQLLHLLGPAKRDGTAEMS